MADDDIEYVYSDDDALPESPSRRTAAPAPAPASSVRSGVDYRRLAPEEIKAEQGKVIREVATVLEVPPECAHTLLIVFKWNKERLLEDYTADPRAVQKAAGVRANMRAPFFCDICLTDFPASAGFALGCKHVFCRTCWSGFLTAAVADQGHACVFTRCPSEDCGEAVTMSVVTAMAPPDVAARWSRYELQQFVNVAKNMSWCPNPSCGNAFVALGPVNSAQCTCGTRFCFRCSGEAHEPCRCALVDKWKLKCGNDSETANWILSNTKKCPLCSVRIEKNQGCNHIICRSKGCGFEFCWVCLSPWSDHGQRTGGYYACNKFKGSGGAAAAAAAAGGGAAGAGDPSSRAKAELDKYLFFYQRYANHEQAARFAAKHKAQAQRRMQELLEAGGLEYGDVAFLNDATDALLDCRRVLKYTYVYGYYMPGGESSEKRLFEHLQEQLERSTEHLAELTEKPVDKLDRADIVNFTRVTLQFMRHLLEGIDEGLLAAGGGDAAGLLR